MTIILIFISSIQSASHGNDGESAEQLYARYRFLTKPQTAVEALEQEIAVKEKEKLPQGKIIVDKCRQLQQTIASLHSQMTRELDFPEQMLPPYRAFLHLLDRWKNAYTFLASADPQHAGQLKFNYKHTHEKVLQQHRPPLSAKNIEERLDRRNFCAAHHFQKPTAEGEGWHIRFYLALAEIYEDKGKTNLFQFADAGIDKSKGNVDVETHLTIPPTYPIFSDKRAAEDQWKFADEPENFALVVEAPRVPDKINFQPDIDGFEQHADKIHAIYQTLRPGVSIATVNGESVYDLRHLGRPIQSGSELRQKLIKIATESKAELQLTTNVFAKQINSHRKLHAECTVGALVSLTTEIEVKEKHIQTEGVLPEKKEKKIKKIVKIGTIVQISDVDDEARTVELDREMAHHLHRYLQKQFPDLATLTLHPADWFSEGYKTDPDAKQLCDQLAKRIQSLTWIIDFSSGEEFFNALGKFVKKPSQEEVAEGDESKSGGGGEARPKPFRFKSWKQD